MSRYFTSDRWVSLLRGLAQRGGDFVTVQSLRRLTGLDERAVRKAVLRLQKKGYLTRVGRNLYADRFGHPTLESLAMILGAPCYISFESALERYGIISQMPLVLTCASTSRSGMRRTPLGDIRFHRIKPELFFGYRSEDGVLWAEPEKALLDWIYLHLKRHGSPPALDELDVSSLDAMRLAQMLPRYPASVARAVKAVGLVE